MISSVSNPSKSPKKASTNETEGDTTSKIASLSEKAEESQSSSKDPRASSVSTSSKSSKERVKSETKPETTSKIPSFEELIAKFDLNKLRSHDYLYLCTIQKAPANLQQLLDGCNWLETKRGMKNWYWHYGTLKLYNIQAIIRFYTKRVTIQLLEVTGPDPFVNNAIADSLVIEITAYLEDQFPGLLLFDPVRRSKIAVKKTHHALPYHPIALRAMEINYRVQGRKFGVDNSQGKRELETHDPPTSTEDMDNYIEDLDFMAANDYWFRDSARDIQQNGRILHTTTKIQKKAAEIQEKAAKQIEEVSKTQLWSISGQRHQTEVQQSFINGSMHLIEQNLALQERVKALEQHLPKISKMEDFFKEREMFDPAFTLVKRLEHIVRKNPGISRADLKQNFGWKEGSVGPTIERLAKRINLKEENRRLLIID